LLARIGKNSKTITKKDFSKTDPIRKKEVIMPDFKVRNTQIKFIITIAINFIYLADLVREIVAN